MINLGRFYLTGHFRLREAESLFSKAVSMLGDHNPVTVRTQHELKDLQNRSLRRKESRHFAKASAF